MDSVLAIRFLGESAENILLILLQLILFVQQKRSNITEEKCSLILNVGFLIICAFFLIS